MSLRLAALLSVLAAALPCGEARAAGIDWTGAGDNRSWSDGLNWYPSGVPATGSDVTIASSTLIVIGAGENIDLNSITLGDGISSPTLKTQTGFKNVGVFTAASSATLIFDTNLVSTMGVVTINSGALISQLGPVESATVAVRMMVQTFELQAGATITLSGRGYAGGGSIANGKGPGGGLKGSASAGGGGGGHGSLGGDGSNAGGLTGIGGITNDSQKVPEYMGSGGGGGLAPCFGGPGGGLLRLFAATATINGLIDVDGGAAPNSCSGGGGGGAGGGVYIETQFLHGRGTFTARGGNGGAAASTGGGGGAGGRVAFSISSATLADFSVDVAAGLGGPAPGSGNPGANGATYADPKIYVGNAGGNCSTAGNWFSGLTPQINENILFGSSNTLTGCIWNVGVFGGSLGNFTITPEFQGIITWSAAFSDIGGDFTIAGGTLASTNSEIKLAGNWNHTGGVFLLDNGTVTFNGSGAQTIAQQPGSYFRNLRISGAATGANSVQQTSDLVIRGNTTLGARFENSSGGYKIRLWGDMLDKPPDAVGDTEWIMEGAAPQSVSTGPYFALTINNTSSVTFSGSDPPGVGPGDLTIGPDAILDISGRDLELGGDFMDLGGTFTVAGATLSFANSTQTVTFNAPGIVLEHVDIRKLDGTVLWLTSATIGGNLTLRSTSTLSVANGSTITALGHWTHIEQATLAAGTGTVVFAGSSPQVVYTTAAAAFHQLHSSNTTTVTLSTDVVVLSDLEMHAGTLDFSGTALRVRGDLLSSGGSNPAVTGSTLTLDGGTLQNLVLGPFSPALDSLVIANSSSGVVLVSSITVQRNFTIQSGTTFYAQDRTLTLTGDGGLWDSAYANYYSAGGGQHVVRWNPSGGAATLYVTNGSTVDAHIDAYNTVSLQGYLFIKGAGNSFNGQPGLTFVATNSLVHLADDCDFVFPADGAYVHDANSWIIFAGSGTDRGLNLSTGPFANIRLSPDYSTSTFAFNNITLDGSLVLDRGLLRNNGDRTLVLAGDLLNNGGTVQYSMSSTGTVRFAGGADQTVLLRDADEFSRFETASSSRVILAGGRLNVAGDFVLSSGTLRAGSALLNLRGDWSGTGGGFLAEASTVVFSSAGAGAAARFTDGYGVTFNGLSLQVPTMVFNSSFTAAVLTSTRTGGLNIFTPTGADRYTVSDLRINGGSVSDRIRIRSSVPGTLFGISIVSVSSVTAADIQDSNAVGTVIHANDGDSVDSGNNINWNIKPNLVLIAPGESFAETIGKTGTPSVQTAGAPFTVTVRAVSSNFRTRTDFAGTVSVTSDDPYDTEPAPAALTGGVGTFIVSLRIAEPAPYPSPLQAASAGVFAGTSAVIGVNPAYFDRLQLTFEGETLVPGSPDGISGVPNAKVIGLPFGVTVRATDPFWNLRTGETDTVELSTAAVSSVTLPSPVAMTGGRGLFAGIYSHTTTSMLLRARDLTNGNVKLSTGQPVVIFGLSVSSPIAMLGIAQDSIVPTLGGALVGTASDSVAVTEVRLSIKDSAAGKFFDWTALAFSSGAPEYKRAAISPQNSPQAQWSLSFPDERLTSGKEYYVLLQSSNPSQYVSSVYSTFTFDTGGLVFDPTDGQGTAAVLPAATVGCRQVISTVTFTVGADGIGKEGAVALRVPEGWTRPTALAGLTPQPGQVRIIGGSAAYPASTEVTFNPPRYGGTELGDQWVLVSVKASAANEFAGGDTLQFVYSGFPPNGPAGQGVQFFDLRTQGAASGNLVSISTVPSLTLSPGTASALRFDDQRPLILGPLQASATMRLLVTDACGNPAAAAGAAPVVLSAGVPETAGFAVDANAEFFLGGTPTNSVQIGAGESASQPFYFRTSTTGVGFELLRATAVLAGGAAAVDRPVRLRASAVALTGVSIDSGTLIAGATSVLVVPGRSGSRAVVRFRLPDAALRWEVVVATDSTFDPPVFTAAGFGRPDAPVLVAFDGMRCRRGSCGFLPPGTYPVRIRSPGSTAEDTTLEVRVDAAPMIYGVVRLQSGAAGAGAVVRADGPGSGVGSFAVASSTGYFQIFGLRDGGVYTVTADTAVFVSGQHVTLSTRVFGVSASSDVGTSTFPAASFIRVNVGIPMASPIEFFGRVSAHDASYAAEAFGTLHFSSGRSRSDDGGTAMSLAASTWTTLHLPPGIYDLDVDLGRIGVTTQVAGVSLAAGGMTDVTLQLERPANVYGFIVLPSTKPFGAPVSVRALRQGATYPAAFAGTFVEASTSSVAITSAPYRLYGLSAGTWMLTAQGEGYVSVSSTLYVAAGTDIGDPVWGVGNLNFTLGLGGVIYGTVTVTGDTTALFDPPDANAPAGRSGFSVYLTAYDPATYEMRTQRVRLSTNTTVTSATYTLTGLTPGTHALSAFLAGFEKSPPGAESVAVSSITQVNMSFVPVSGGLRLNIDLPPAGGACRPAADYGEVGLFVEGPDIGPEVYADITVFDNFRAGVVEELFCSSMSLTVPGLGTGVHNFRLMHGPSGNAQDLFLPLISGATAAVRVDLAAATYTVSGTAAISGVVRFSGSDFAISVSSAAGLVAQSTRAAYCLLSSSEPVTLSAARVELVALDRRGGTVPGPLRISTAADCLRYSLAPSSAAPPALVAYAAELTADGSYTIAGVPAGAYLLRTPGDLDGDSSNGDEAAPVRKVLNVTGDLTADVEIGNGASVRGTVSLPPGYSLSRPVAVSLLDGRGKTVRRQVLHFAKKDAVSYVFEQVADGAYAVTAEDIAQTKGFAAKPLLLTVAGADLDDQDLELRLAGRIRGRLAVERSRPEGTRDFAVITPDNRDLLPGGLKIAAAADPWFQGGLYEANGDQCNDLGCGRAALDAEGAFVIEGVLPGSYNLEFYAVSGAADAQAGRPALVPTRRAGIGVEAARTTDVGVVRLRMGATLGGQVTDAVSGEGLANIRIMARPMGGAPGAESSRILPPETQAGRDGRYELRGLDPEVRYYEIIAAEREDGASTGETPAYERTVYPTIDIRSTATLNIALRRAAFTATGRVVSSGGGSLSYSENGESRPGARLYLQKEGVIATRSPFGDILTHAAPDGSYSVPGLAPGSYRLRAAALNHAPAVTAFTITVSSVDIGTMTLDPGATLSGSIRFPDGTAPGEDDIAAVLGATPDQGEVLSGTLTKDPVTRTVTGYRLSGFRRDTVYRLVFITPRQEVVSPAEGYYVVFASSVETRGLDLVFRRRKPYVLAKSRRTGADFLLEFQTSHPLRARTSDDSDLSRILSTTSALGTLKNRELSTDRQRLRAEYTPAVGESSFTVRLKAYSALKDPDSSDTVNAEFMVNSTFSFYAGLDGYQRTSIPNLAGGALALEGDSGRVALPEGAFFVDPSSAVLVTFQRSSELLTDAERYAASGLSPAAANLRSLRYPVQAYPPGVLSALAATPPQLDPLSAFYDVLLPLGVRTALAAPVKITLRYAAGVDPAELNVYWYNPAANAYVLQQDATGAAPEIDTANRTITIHVSHFSTFVLFQTGVSVITGNSFGGGEIEAYNFPNPFDLKFKTVTPVHGVAAQSVRGTMIRIGLPADASGGASLHIFNIAGQRVRTIDLGTLRGGQTYYQPWDGRGDGGRDVASGVYFAQVKVGDRFKFFKMAVIE
ncbi:MAG: FlgD immunoglobulin-like domain containing protein [Elusimicrobiota bacterium]